MTVAIPGAAFEPKASAFDASWKRHAALLAGVWVALLLMFAGDVRDLAAKKSDEKTAAEANAALDRLK